jgi:uncharacterized protein YwgA
MLASELDHLDAILLSAFSWMKRIPGKKALQKYVYFLKESRLDVDFKFQWDKWGPYSSELATYVDDLVAEELLDSEEEKVPFGGRIESRGIQYNFSVTPRAEKLLASVHLSSDERKKIEDVVKFVRDIKPSNLELYASVHYIVNFLSTKGERDLLPRSLIDLMDDYKRGRFDDAEIKTAYYNLKTYHLL